MSLRVHPHGCFSRSKVDIHADIESLIKNVGEHTGKWRASATARLTALDNVGLLSRQQRLEFVEALFVHTDESGFPADTEHYDFLVLGLPRISGMADRQLFRSKYILNEEQPKAYWRELSGSVERFGQPRGSRRRSVRWARRDLDVILERAQAWLNEATPKLTTPAPPMRSAFEGIFGGESIKATYLHWLETLEDVVLLGRNTSRPQRDAVASLLQSAQKAGLTTTKVAASLCCLGMMDEPTATSHIRQSLSSRESSDIWSGCCAVARWCVRVKI